VDEIRYFGGAYFHQDYDLLADSPLAVVRKFVAAEERETSQALLRELDELLAAPPTEDEALRLWHTGTGAAYRPTHGGLTYLQWFAAVRDVVREQLSQPE
jgi:hypothetical protein